MDSPNPSLDALIDQLESELRARPDRDLPVTRLRMQTELGERVIAWSFPGTADADLDIPKAKAVLNKKLGTIGMRLSSGGILTGEADGSVLMFWRVGPEVPFFGSGSSQQVRFLRKYTKGKGTYEVYQALTAEAAREFLLKRKVDAPCCYIVVETPEGNWGIDLEGLYLEHLLPWQSDLSQADVVGCPAEGLGGQHSQQAAALGYADNFIHGVICGMCSYEWLDGLRLNQKTVVRCPKCRAMNLVTSPPRDFWIRG